MTQPARRIPVLRFPLVLRHVAANRELLAREALPGVGSGHDQTWWELVDAAGDESRPPSAVAVTGSVRQEGRVALLAAAGQDLAALEQLIDALMVALRGTPAEIVVAAARVDGDLAGVLLRAGFAPGASSGCAGDAEPQLQFEL